MKRFLILTSFVGVVFGSVLPESRNDENDKIEVDPAQSNYYGNLMNMMPGDREMMGMQFPSNEYMGYPGMSMNYPSMMMPGMNFPGPFQGQYQGVGRKDACGCTSTCGMPCMWWGCSPCIPCPICPEESTTTIQPTVPTLPTVTQELTTLPPSNNCPCNRVCPPCMPWFPCNPCSCPCSPDNNTPPTTTVPTTTTVLTTVTQEITQSPPDDCVPCLPCMPCGPIWWMPCGNCNCNNGCQTTVAPIKAPPRYNENNSNKNNCQCKCAPCPPWVADCPPCPKNCPCN